MDIIDNVDRVSEETSPDKVGLPQSSVRINTGNCLEGEGTPFQRIILGYLTAVSNKDSDHLRKILSHDLRWISIGRESTEGIEEFLKALLISNQEITEVRIESLLSQGMEGSSRTSIFKKDGLKINLGEFFRFRESDSHPVITDIFTFVIEEDVLPD